MPAAGVGWQAGAGRAYTAIAVRQSDTMVNPARETLLPVDADGVLKLAAQSMFDTLASTAMGMMVVDREHLSLIHISEPTRPY